MIPQRSAILPFTLALTSFIAGATAQQTSIHPGPCCGVNSLYTALKTEGLNLKFSRLLQRKYVSSSAGSTLVELLQAARDSGAKAQLVENLSVRDLRQLNCPAILHVKTEFDAPEFNHFVLCVPTTDGRLALFDPPGPLVRTAGHELAPVWDGTALLVSAQPIRLDTLREWAIVRSGLAIAAALAAVGIVFLIRRAHHGTTLAFRLHAGPLTQCLLLICGAAFAAGIYHLFSPEGFVAQRQAVIAISMSAQPPARVALPEARKLREQGALFVDARRTEDFGEGHIPGALNVPPDASRLDRAHILADCPKTSLLVVYCESSSCAYATLLARRLSREGFDHVSVFTGGWVQWQDSTGSHAQANAAAAPMEGGS